MERPILRSPEFKKMRRILENFLVFAKILIEVVSEMWKILVGGMQFIVWIAISQTFDIGFWKFIFFIVPLTGIVPLILPPTPEADKFAVSLAVQFVAFWIAILFLLPDCDGFECYKLLSTYREISGPVELFPALTCCCTLSSLLRGFGNIMCLILYAPVIRLSRFLKALATQIEAEPEEPKMPSPHVEEIARAFKTMMEV